MRSSALSPGSGMLFVRMKVREILHTFIPFSNTGICKDENFNFVFKYTTIMTYSYKERYRYRRFILPSLYFT
jgi:hypothetical protein